MAMSKEEWEEWMASPATQAFRTALVVWRESLKEQWAQGGLVEPIASAQGIAQVRLLDDLAKMTFDDYLTTMGVQSDEAISIPSPEAD